MLPMTIHLPSLATMRRQSIRLGPRAAACALMAALYLVLTAGLYAARPEPIDVIDFRLFYSGVRALLAGQSLYGQGFANPPYVALALIPFALFPEPVALALFDALVLVIAVLIAQRYRLGAVQTLGFILGPFLVSDLLSGQITLLVMGAVLLPVSWWPLAAVAKPQVAAGLLLRPTRAGALLLAGALALSFLLVPTWLSDMLSYGQSLPSAPWNAVRHLWPFTLCVG